MQLKFPTFFVLLVIVSTFCAQRSSGKIYESQYVRLLSNGKLFYAPYNEHGDTVADFSQVGYRHGDVEIPNVPTKKTLNPLGGGKSDVAQIQNAIYDMATYPIDATGFRGAVLLSQGEYNIDSTIFLNVSGVVLRGEGRDKTTLYGSGKFAYNLIQAGNADVIHKYFGKVLELTDYIKVGTKQLEIPAAQSNFKVGDKVFIIARKNQAWIEKTGMNLLKSYAPADRKNITVDWVPFDSRHERTVTAVTATTVTVDVPLVEAVDPQWGGGYIRKYTLEKAVDHVGMEDLCSYSYFDPKITLPYSSKNSTRYYADENHAERLVIFLGALDSFARRICGRHFNHFVAVKSYSKRVTVRDASHTSPVSKLDGERRYTYHLHKASEVLFDNCHASEARHAFVFSSRTTGPNVFFNCTSQTDFANSEPHDRWSVAGLYDNCVGDFSIQNRLYYGTGHGWGGANFVAWNTEGSLQLHSPVTDWNFAVGHTGLRKAPTFAYANGGADRMWEQHGVHVEPKSLFLAQVAERKASTG